MTNDEADTMIEDCENRESRLTDWERSFIDSLANQRRGDNPFTLTDRQVSVLERIWNKATERG